MGLKVNKDIKEQFEWTRKHFWPSIDDAAQSIYDNANDKETIELKFSPHIYSYARKAITIGIITTLIAGYALNQKHDYTGKLMDNVKKEVNSAEITKSLEKIFYSQR